MRFRPDGRVLVSAHWDHTVRVFDQKRLKPLAILRYACLHALRYGLICVHPQPLILPCRQHRDSVYAVDFPDPDCARVTLPVEPTEYSPTYACEDTSTPGIITPAVFATGSKDTTIALWNLFADSYS
jgi:WD40 repeat protein